VEGGRGDVWRSVAAVAGRQRPGAGGCAWRVGGHPEHGTLGWLPGGVLAKVQAAAVEFISNSNSN
jgi:hypothetical protein